MSRRQLAVVFLAPVVLLAVLAGIWGLIAAPAVTSAVTSVLRACTSQEPAMVQTADCAPGPSVAATATAFGGGDGYVDDPTSSGRVTRRTLHVHDEVARVFDRSAGVACWDEHAWNPSSDHPRGRACDFTVGRIGARPTAAQRVEGWQLANWLRREAGPLGVRYVIFDGKIWSAARDGQGWRPYTGGGVYDPQDVTGGHFDHVHVSVT